MICNILQNYDSKYLFVDLSESILIYFALIGISGILMVKFPTIGHKARALKEKANPTKKIYLEWNQPIANSQ